MENNTIEHLPTAAGYDRWAEIYDAEDNPLIALEEPCVENLLGNVAGLAIADIGCGTGRHAIRLAQAGARVYGLDFSSRMMELARHKAKGLDITFQHHDLTTALPFPADRFDRVVCGLVLDHIPDLENLFREMHRICKPSGFVVISVMHPALMLRGVQARFHDPHTGQEVRPASCPHQLSDYVLAAVRAGLSLNHLSEHAVDDALAQRMERAQRYLGWLLLFMMRLQPIK
jgi:ubiquinone/menaquinone biosynthesis C-methylase UbiE